MRPIKDVGFFQPWTFSVFEYPQEGSSEKCNYPTLTHDIRRSRFNIASCNRAKDEYDFTLLIYEDRFSMKHPFKTFQKNHWIQLKPNNRCFLGYTQFLVHLTYNAVLLKMERPILNNNPIKLQDVDFLFCAMPIYLDKTEWECGNALFCFTASGTPSHRATSIATFLISESHRAV